MDQPDCCRGRLIGTITCAALLFAGQVCQSQYSLGGLEKFNKPTDARSVAMGESFVALPHNPSALLSNPAGLAQLEGAGAGYSRRTLSSWLDGAASWSADAYIHTPAGTIGMRYDRENFGELPIVDAQHPNGTGSALKLTDETIMLALSHQFGKHWSAGIGVKTFQDHFYDSRSEVVSHPYLFDFGIMFTAPPLFSIEQRSDELNIGVAVQNVGTPYRLKATMSIYQSAAPTEYWYDIPRYVRAGASYRVTWQGTTPEDLSPCTILMTAEYRNHFGAVPFSRSIPARHDYAGLGLEVTLFEILHARVGEIEQPNTSEYGESGRGVLRYGAGLSLPLSRLGLEIPMTVEADYAAFTLVSPEIAMAKATRLHAVTLRLHYDTKIM